MAETEGNREKMPKQKGERSVLALTGATAILVLAVNFGIKVYNSRKQNKKKKGFVFFSELLVFFSSCLNAANLPIRFCHLILNSCVCVFQIFLALRFV